MILLAKFRVTYSSNIFKTKYVYRIILSSIIFCYFLSIILLCKTILNNIQIVTFILEIKLPKIFYNYSFN